MSYDEIKHFIIHYLTSKCGVLHEQISENKSFSSYGLDSLNVANLLSELNAILKQEISITIFWEYPSIKTLANELHRLLTIENIPNTKLPIKTRKNEHEPNSATIGIIGMQCRFPGASDLSAFWHLLTSGKDAILDQGITRHHVHIPYPGGYIEAIDEFDHQFFNISEHEASHMDPQQRLLLQGVVDALTDAGLTLESLENRSVGVFIGIHAGDYSFRRMVGQNADIFTITGNVSSIAANRISHQFGFTGPSLSVNTACSSSLLAVHLACNSLKENECDLAIVGSANLILEPQVSKALEQTGMISPDGRCQTFSKQANGYVRSEGVGVIVLKRYDEALSDHDRIYASILGGATNQDGKSNGLTAPNLKAQIDLVSLACKKANVPPEALQFVELHGTGTQVGDAIEAKALGTVLNENRTRRTPCWVGSVKSNIGHLEPAAGLAGIIKLSLCLYHHTLVPSLHFSEPNPNIPFDSLPIQVNLTKRPWPDFPQKQPLAGISSFGFGGSNVHIIMTDAGYHHQDTTQPLDPAPSTYLLPFSAEHPDALRKLLNRHRDFILNEPNLDFYQYAYNLCIRTSHFKKDAVFWQKTKTIY